MEKWGSARLFIGPRARGAPDRIRTEILEVLSGNSALILSQQLSDRDILNELAVLRHRIRSSAELKILVERDYLVERDVDGPGDFWATSGRREENREGFMALLRSDIDVRFDSLRSQLQHTNIVISRLESSGAVLLTSANFSRDSLDRDLNWAVSIEDGQLGVDCANAFNAAWDGDFRDVTDDLTFPGGGDRDGLLTIGAGGSPTEAFVQDVSRAEATVCFAFFNISTDSAGALALQEAAARGVHVTGIVDADQGNQSWDAVPSLRAAGVDVLYYPGALTGASGRMHHKFATVDGTLAHLSTANLSASAESSLEAALTMPGAIEFVGAMDREVKRLIKGGSVEPLRVLSP